MRIASALVVFLVAIAIFSCEDTTLFTGNLDKRTTYLNLNYTNPDTTEANNTGIQPVGDAPSIALNQGQSSSAIKIDFDKEFTGKLTDDGRVEIVINNLRVADEFGNFTINNLRVEEMQEGRWVLQSAYENPTTYEPMQKLDVMLVLDASGSMIEVNKEVKNAARNFVKKVSSRINDARFGIIAFNDAVQQKAITSNTSEIYSFIDNISFGGSKSPLYSSMITANEMLQQSDAESKVMLTLTDGLDNRNNYTHYNVVDTMNNEQNDVVKVQSYIVGFSGDAGVKKDFIEPLAVRGFSLYPDDGDEMEEFFDYFSKVVATVYSVTYRRGSEAREEDNPLQLRFILETEQQ